MLALVCSFLAGGCNSGEGGPLASSEPTDAPPGAPPDTSAGVPPDTSAGAPPDTSAGVPPVDTVPVDPQPPPAPPVSYTGLPYGPSSLWYLADVKAEPQPFTASQNYINADSIVQQINAARALDHRLIL